MKTIFKVLALVLALALPSLAFAAGSVVTSTQTQGKLRVIIFAWTCDASGDVDADATDNGVFVRGGTVFAYAAMPESGVSNLYDVKIQLKQPIRGPGTVREITFADALSGDAQNLSSSTDGEFTIISVPFALVAGRVYLIVENAGVEQSGTFILYVWEE